jgi:hypothetical protein
VQPAVSQQPQLRRQGSSGTLAAQEHQQGQLRRRGQPLSRAFRDLFRMCIFYGVQKCPFDAIMIINLPKDLEKETTHRYGPNSFKLHRWAGSGVGAAGMLPPRCCAAQGPAGAPV